MPDFEPDDIVNPGRTSAMRYSDAQRKQKVISLIANFGTILVFLLYATIPQVLQDQLGYNHPYLSVVMISNLVFIAIHFLAIFLCSKRQMLASAISIPVILYVLGIEYFRYVFHLVW